MRCPEFRDWMSLKLDGRLGPDEEWQFTAHLDVCPTCAQEWRLWQDIGDLFTAPPMVEPPEDLAAQVMVRIRHGPHRGAVWGSLALLTVGAAVLVGLFILLPLADFCALAVTAAQSPGLLAVVVSALAHLLEVAAMLAEACRLLAWGIVHSPSLLATLVYLLVAVGAMAAWLRVAVFRKAPLLRG